MVSCRVLAPGWGEGVTCGAGRAGIGTGKEVGTTFQGKEN